MHLAQWSFSLPWIKDSESLTKFTVAIKKCRVLLQGGIMISLAAYFSDSIRVAA